jgi:hypothetical protein
MYWSLEEALTTDINYLFLAHSGHAAELNALFGDGKPPAPPGQIKGGDGRPLGERKLTPEEFDAAFSPNGEREIRYKSDAE